MAHNDPVFSLLKGLDILKTVGGAVDGLRLSDIAQAMGWKVPATHHLVRTLLMADFLEKGPDGRLRLGSALALLGEKAIESPQNIRVERVLLDLHRVFPEATVIFGHPVGAEMRQTRRVSPDRPGVLQRTGMDVMHPYASAGGLLALAFSNEEERLVLEGHRPFAEHGQALWKGRDKLESFLSQGKIQFRVTSPFDTDLYVRVAMGIRDRDGALGAILGLSHPQSAVKKMKEGDVYPALEARVNDLESPV